MQTRSVGFGGGGWRLHGLTLLRLGGNKLSLTLGELSPSCNGVSSTQVMFDLLEFAARSLVLGGRLVFLLPVLATEYCDADVPSHPCLEVIANAENPLNLMLSRRMIVMRKTQHYETARRLEYAARVHVGRATGAEEMAVSGSASAEGEGEAASEGGGGGAGAASAGSDASRGDALAVEAVEGRAAPPATGTGAASDSVGGKQPAGSRAYEDIMSKV